MRRETERKTERDLLHDCRARSSALFGVNGHLSESDVSSLAEDGKEHLVAAKTTVYRKIAREMGRERWVGRRRNKRRAIKIEISAPLCGR